MSTFPTPVTPPSKPVTNPAKRVMPANVRLAGMVSLSLLAVLYLIEFLDTVIPGDFDQAGIQSRTLSGLDGILWAPLLHHGWGHLLSNTIPVAVFAFLAMAGGIAQWVAVTATIWLGGGLLLWLVGPSPAVTVGASGVAFGWLAYLLVRGIFNRSIAQLAVAAVLLFLWGGMLWSLLPGNPQISWQGHLSGAIAGIFAAWVVSRANKSDGEKPTDVTPLTL